ncbi:BolA/IbaG family iron-sulfur metabolism protein [Porticoccaceae bacterium LTM1]|nr:BolA/IbaG family iron-sulfur metabolism protein [Porticoccaceae bacterium LTM1]
MQPEEVKQVLQEQMPDCQISVESEGGHYRIVAIGEIFEGLRAVKRQQLIYAALNSHIASGAIHAVYITAKTPAEVQ